MQKQEHSEKDIEHYDGITIRNFPRILNDEEIHTFLLNYGLPHDHNVTKLRFNKGARNTWVIVDGLCSNIVQTMFRSIHFHETKQKFFDVPLYCTAMRNTTPTKKKDAIEQNKPAKTVTAEQQTKCDSYNTLAATIAVNDASIVIQEVSDKKSDKDKEEPKIPGFPDEERSKKKKKKKRSKEGTIETTEGNNWKQKIFCCLQEQKILKRRLVMTSYLVTMKMKVLVLRMMIKKVMLIIQTLKTLEKH